MMHLKRYVWVGLGVFAVLGSIFFLLSRQAPSQKETRVPDGDQKMLPKSLKKSAINLYFADKENLFLNAETRSLPWSVQPDVSGNIIFEALEKGSTAGLTRTIPKGTRLRGFYLTEDGTAIIDLSESVSENHPGGCKTEVLTIYSLVNSLVLNIPEIESVKILLGGKEAMTLAGHVDLQFPFKANMLLIR